MDFLTHIDLKGNELRNFVIQKLLSAPSNPEEARVYYDRGLKAIRLNIGTGWVTLIRDEDLAAYLALAGGTMTGPLTLSGAPTANLHAATKKYVDDAINGLALISISVVQTLPVVGEANVIYFVPKATAETNNAYEEYIWIADDNSYECIGDTTVDLSNYLQKTGNASNTTAAFTAAGTRALPVTGESLAVIFGKIVKYLNDLSTVAFSGDYTDLSNKPASPALDTATMTTSQTSKSITATGTTVVSVIVLDSVTHEQVLCDVNVNGKSVTVAVAETPANALEIRVLSV